MLKKELVHIEQESRIHFWDGGSDKSSVNLDGPMGSYTSNLARLNERFNKNN